MTGTEAVVLAYVLGFGIIGGYATYLLALSATVSRRERELEHPRPAPAQQGRPSGRQETGLPRAGTLVQLSPPLDPLVKSPVLSGP